MRVVYKTKHNIFYRRVWRAVSAVLDEARAYPVYVVTKANGAIVELPVDGTIFRFTRGLVPTKKV